MSIVPFTVGIPCGVKMADFGGGGCIHMYTHMLFIMILMKVEKIKKIILKNFFKLKKHLCIEE